MSKELILCVDDESIVLDSLREQLQNEFGNQYLIEIAESGEEALEIVNEFLDEEYEIPVVIADFIMPDLKGDALLSQVHQLLPRTKNIMLTGQASIEGVSNAVNQANLFRYISKPWDKDDLILTIREALNSFHQAQLIEKQNQELLDLNANLERKIELRTKELAEINNTKDKFFSIIAHDLKNPFNTLLGFSDLLLENINGFSQEKILEYVRIIYDTSRSSYTLLENLLEWSRTQTGKIKMEKTVFDIYKLAKENINLHNNSAVKKGIVLENCIPKDSYVFADANMVNTVIRNLVSNAVKYTRKEGEIVLFCKEEDSILKVNVKDSGVGMSPDTMNKIFRIDVNISTKGTNNEKGTGLGLILCKEFIKKNNGEISVESKEGEGSVFSFTLPLRPD